MAYAMAVPAEERRTSFKIYVTHVDGDGHLLKISGQLNRRNLWLVDSLLESTSDNFANGIGEVPPALIQEGIICAVKYKNGIYYRAKIINTTRLAAGLVGVHFIDYGNRDSVAPSAIRFLDIYDTRLLKLGGLASDFYLTRLMHPSDRWDEQLLVQLRGLLCYAEYPATIKGQSRTLPIIYLQYRGYDLTTHLVSNGYGIEVPVAKQEVMIQPSQIESSGSFSLYQYYQNFPSNQSAIYTTRYLGVNYKYKVFVSFAEEGPEQFAVQLVKDAKLLDDTMHAINMRPRSYSCFAEPPMIGTQCLGRCPKNNTICRAVIKEVSNTECTLFFVDFGKTETVHYYDVYEIPEDFIKPYVLAMRFCLSCVRLLKKGPYLNEAFKQLVTGKVMTLRVVGPEGPPLIQYGKLYLDNKNVLDLLLVDYGIEQEVDASGLRTITSDLPVQALQCALKTKPTTSSSKVAPEQSSSLKTEQRKSRDVLKKQDRKEKQPVLRLPPAESFHLYKRKGDRAGGESTSSDSGNHAGRSFGRDSTQHQYKRLANPAPLDTPFAEPQIESDVQHEVSVAWTISPRSFYVQMVSLQPEFEEMMRRIPELYTGVQPYTGDICVGASVLARWPVDGLLYRAAVVSVLPLSKFVVQYVDFGNKELVDAKDIWQLDRQLMELPRVAIHCAMIGVQPLDGGWKAIPEMELFLNAPVYQCIFQGVDVAEGHHMVHLFNNGVSVLDMMIEKKMADLSHVAHKEEAIDLSVLEGQQIPCRVSYVESHEKFYIHLDLEKADLVEKAVDACDVNLLTPLTRDALTDGVHCTVKHADRIYRAFLTDTSDTNNVVAVLPDRGETIATSLDNLMVLPWELSVYRYQAVECCLNNYKAESTVLVPLEELKTSLAGNKFIVHVDGVQGTRLMTTLYDMTTGQKLSIFEPDECVFDEVFPVCAHTVFSYHLGSCRIQHLQSLEEIYLQRVADADRARALLDRLNAFYEEGNPEPLMELEPGVLCAAKSSAGSWFRASVVSCTDSDVTVQFHDYGHTETIARDMARMLDPAFHEPCEQVLSVRLGLLALNDDAIKNLSEWTKNREVRVLVAPGTNRWIASLRLDGVDLSTRLVNEQLARLKFTEEAAAPEIDPVLRPFTYSQAYISHIDTPGQFWLRMADKIDMIDEIQAALAADADKCKEDLRLELGTLCVARYSAVDLWSRALVIDLDSGAATVRFIDYGNCDVVGPGQLKVMPEKLRAIEPLAVLCSVNAFPSAAEWTERARESFVALVGDTSLAVDALMLPTGVTTFVDLFVDGRNVSDQLVSQGHARRVAFPVGCGETSRVASHVESRLESESDPDLDESTHTVIENKLFEANPLSLNESRDHNSSSETIESTSGTIKTIERDCSKDSIDTDTGNTSSDGTKDSPEKADNVTAEMPTGSYDNVTAEMPTGSYDNVTAEMPTGSYDNVTAEMPTGTYDNVTAEMPTGSYDNIEIETKELETETKQETVVDVKSNEVETEANED